MEQRAERMGKMPSHLRMRRLNRSHAGSCGVMSTSASPLCRCGSRDGQPRLARSRTAVATQRLRNGNDADARTARATPRLTKTRRLLLLQADRARPRCSPSAVDEAVSHAAGLRPTRSLGGRQTRCPRAADAQRRRSEVQCIPVDVLGAPLMLNNAVLEGSAPP